MNAFNELKHNGTFEDKDGTIKAVFEAKSGAMEISFIINKADRGIDVFCVPTHHYCNLGCKFCHLTTGSTVKQMVSVSKDNLFEAIFRTLHKKSKGAILTDELYSENGETYSSGLKRSACKKALISFMGAGDSLLNIELIKAVFDDEETLKKICGYDEISYALATIMPNKNLEKLTEYVTEKKMPLKIHFSMHSPFTDERQQLIPQTKLSVEEVLKLLNEYKQKAGKIQEIVQNFSLFHKSMDFVEIHYTLISGVNDSDKHLQKLAEFALNHKITVKLLRFNPINNMRESAKLSHWVKFLTEKNEDVRVKVYSPPGKDIGSSCGQFTKYYYISEPEKLKCAEEFNQWKSTYEIVE